MKNQIGFIPLLLCVAGILNLVVASMGYSRNIMPAILCFISSGVLVMFRGKE